MRSAKSVLLFSGFAGSLVACGFLATPSQSAAQNAQQPTTANASPMQLQPFTAPDQSASAGVPSGWHVTTAAQTDIVISGPNNETVFLGRTVVTRNGPFQLGQRLGGGIDFSMPYQANLAQKFTMIIQQNAAARGGQPAQLNVVSATPLPFPPTLGQCGRFVGDISGDRGPMKFEALMCSLAVDSGGVYKTMFKMGSLPANLAVQERALVEAIFASYRVPLPMLQRKLAPFTPRPTAGGGGGLDSSTIWRERAVNDSAECMDLVVLRELPKNKLPIKCGGTKEDD